MHIFSETTGEDIKMIVTSHTEAICADPHRRSPGPPGPLTELGMSGYPWVDV